MHLKSYKPITPSQRQLIRLNNVNLQKKPLIKNKINGFANNAGKNSSGKITIRHKGGGHKKNYRQIQFNRSFVSEGIICSIEYDPNRNARIASVYDVSKNKFFYIIAAHHLKTNDIVKSGSKADINIGHSLPLKRIPEGTYVYNVAINASKKGGQVARSAGTFAIVVEKTLGTAWLKLSSGNMLSVPSNLYATVGVVSNQTSFLARFGKAGNSRWVNKRPSVRGVAMNPIDHPHGGGEGKKSGGGRTPWGKIQK
jgi:large subunit ribosomal protein L2